jgi:tyrosine-specific transport protein
MEKCFSIEKEKKLFLFYEWYKKMIFTKNPFQKVLGGALLVAGTSIGAGMLALPIVTGLSGLYPSVFIYLISWAIMTITGLLFLEICLTFPQGTNIISMANHYLGKKGQICSWIVYLFLFYCLSIAYVSTGGELVFLVLGKKLSYFFCVTIFMLLFGSIVYIGAAMVHRVNSFLMVGLVLSFVAFLVFGWKHVDPSYFSFMKWKESIWTFPVIIVAFGYQGIVPSLTSYLQRDAKSVRWAIVGGTSLTLLIYLVWEYFILGILPLEKIIEAKAHGWNAVHPLQFFIEAKLAYTMGQFFSFFAITTSFLGVSLGLFDFFADGLQIPNKGKSKIIIALCTFLPTFLITSTHPGLFLIALQYAGGFGGVLLLIFLPAFLVYLARYVKKDPLIQRQVFGGKAVLYFLFFFTFLEIALDFVVR